MRRFMQIDPTVDRHGPADYVINDLATAAHSPIVLMGTARRVTPLDQIVEGPGPAAFVSTGSSGKDAVAAGQRS